MPVTTAELYARFGDPRKEHGISVLNLPANLLAANPNLPKRIYMNNDLHKPFIAALTECLVQGVLSEIKVFSGCFNIRNIRGGTSASKHGFAYAVDWNAGDNLLGYTYEQLRRMGLKPFTEKFLACWRKHGWTCGGDWKNRPDRMHFEM